MKIISIALKEIKTSFRDIRTFTFMLAFPIVLMLILGTALSNAFSNKISVDDIHVLYKDNSEGAVTQPFQSFSKEVKKSGVAFKEIKSGMNGKEEVKNGSYDAYVELNKEGIVLYGSDKTNIESSIVQGMLSAFAGKYNLAAEVAKADPDAVKTVLAPTKDDYIKDTALNSDHQVGSMDYYAIAMTTMIALYGAIGASSLIQGERTRNTADRLMAAPVSKGEIFIGKLLGSLLVNSVCIFAVMAFSKYVYKANWGDHPLFVLAVLLTEVIFAVSLGIGISFMAKTGAGARSIIMLTVQMAAFFGGAYFKIEGAGKMLNFFLDLSPLTWVNHGITKIIFANNYNDAYHAIALNLGFSLILLIIAVISLKRREGL
ncbi:ABC transporter permease [Falsibacillus albus]|uniref:ABC transporter permease n=1 Tax=Falsibacillus albus TaxID=2478915 RepID=A0A3L7K1E6_9BACI|nr:ABC transporter permease [Falsibacillus albus]RLQ96888.1 ABC transporter permease [Falsibacillus albus]